MIFNNEKSNFISLLKEYINVFTWSYIDMPVLNTNIVVHKLPLMPKLDKDIMVQELLLMPRLNTDIVVHRILIILKSCLMG